MHQRFTEAGAQVVGVSRDDIETLYRFSQMLGLPYPLVSDGDGSLARAYNVKEGTRVTFLVDKTGRITDLIDGDDAIDPTRALEKCAPGSKDAPAALPRRDAGRVGSPTRPACRDFCAMAATPPPTLDVARGDGPATDARFTINIVFARR